MAKTTQELVTEFFSRLGLGEAAKGLFPAEGAEPTLDIDASLKGAQDYAKPFLEQSIKDELHPQIKGKVVNDNLGAFAKASNGKITRSDLEGKTIEQALALYNEKVTSEVTSTATEKDQIIERLNAEKANAESEWQGKIDAVKNEYESKEQNRLIATNLQNLLGKRKDGLTVDPSIAAETLLPMLQNKYVLKAEGEDLHLYDKANPTSRIQNATGTGFAKIDDEIDTTVTRLSWNKQSNGSAGQGGAAPRLPQAPQPGQAPVKESAIVAAAREAGMLQS